MAKKKPMSEEMAEKITQLINDECVQKAFITYHEDDELGKYLMLNFHLPEVDIDVDDNEVTLDMVTEEGMGWGCYIADAMKEWMDKNPELAKDKKWIKDQCDCIIGMIANDLYSKLKLD